MIVDNPYDPLDAELQRKTKAQQEAKIGAINALKIQRLPIPRDLEEFYNQYEQGRARS